MPLFQSVLTRASQTKKPQPKFLTHLLGLMLMLPGHATFRHLSLYSPSHERTFARWYALEFHLSASFTAVSLAKLTARYQNGQAAASFSMASLKRRAFNQHLIDRICEHLAKGYSLEKSSPEYDTLCSYGPITEWAA
jgi:hypothetical protein